MFFGQVAIDEALGAIVAHGVKAGGLVVKKGSRVDAPMIAALRKAGIAELTIARLDPDDVGEDAAALTLARAVQGAHIRVGVPFTGRANLFAEKAGILTIAADRIDAVNAVDEAITIATLRRYTAVAAGEMVATVKIIPYAVERAKLDRAIAAIGDMPIVGIAPFRAKSLAVISTILPGLKASVVRKTLSVLQNRLNASGARILAETQIAHEPQALAKVIGESAASPADIVVVFGASAITDRRDVIPTAIEKAGGRIEHLGMPVDPGNLLLIGEIAGKPIIGAPGCARSPKENGFDWVLQRLLADMSVGREEIVSMGVGGLLMEIASRPQPRLGENSENDV